MGCLSIKLVSRVRVARFVGPGCCLLPPYALALLAVLLCSLQAVAAAGDLGISAALLQLRGGSMAVSRESKHSIRLAAAADRLLCKWVLTQPSISLQGFFACASVCGTAGRVAAICYAAVKDAWQYGS